MSADRDITPRVVAHLRSALDTLDPHRRPSPVVAQLVLRQLARWARRTSEPGQWTTTESVEQLVVGTGIPARTVRRALSAIEQAGLVVTVRRGGGHGVNARGSTRLLLLDPAGQHGSTEATRRAQFNPQLRPLGHSTEATNASTEATQVAYTASSSALSSTRAASTIDCIDCAVPIPVAQHSFRCTDCRQRMARR